MKYYQQGDVLLKSVSRIPAEVKARKSYVLAEGEVTGHSHRVMYAGQVLTALETESQKDFPIKMFERDGQIYVDAKDVFTVVHEEHGPIEVPAGQYEIGIVREYDHFAEEARNVRD